MIRLINFILFLITFSGYSQSPVYFSSGNFIPPNNWNQGNAFLMGVVANTNIQIASANTTGNCYFRFYSALSGGTIYESASNSDVLIPTENPFNLQSSGGFGKSFYFIVSSSSANYIFKTSGSGSPGNCRAAVMVVDGAIQTITGLSRYPSGNIFPQQDVTITAQISGALSSGQGVYLRYTTDHWSSSVISEMTGSGTSYSAIIPGSINSSGTTIEYYAFTSGSTLTISHNDADLMTINLINNNFSNFHYNVQCDVSSSLNPWINELQTDLSHYAPGSNVNFKISFKNTISANQTLNIQYLHLADTIATEVYQLTSGNEFSWSWQTAVLNNKGYFVSISLMQGAVKLDSSSIAVDVSSDWNYFPRYGFLSEYSQSDSVYRTEIIRRLNRFHINGLQFYDAHYKHHMPLAGSPSNPSSSWNDIANRTSYLSTVTGYINLAHQFNMNAMSYNLLYGAFSSTAVADGVSPLWGLYTDNQHQNPWIYTLPAGWASNLLFENPANPSWRSYLFYQENNLFQALPYDGWHVDQVGNPGNIYDYYGNTVDLASGFGTFLTNAKSNLNVHLVMNAVTNFGQQNIAQTPVDFLYTEVWNPYNPISDLAQIIRDNFQYSNNSKKTILAAYMNRDLSGNSGSFNTPGVLLADAVIFASGGAHLELGEHMLCNEYFPNNNLKMSCDLVNKLKIYYDFSVAYENLVRDSIADSNVLLQSSGSLLSSTQQSGKIWVLSKSKNDIQVFHLLNLVSATTLNWNDGSGTQAEPVEIDNIALNFNTTRQIKKIWYSSPDFNNGMPSLILFTQAGNAINFSVPKLKYWTMITVEYTPTGTNISEKKSEYKIQFDCYQNPLTKDIDVNINAKNQGNAECCLINLLGQKIKTISINLIDSENHKFILKNDNFDSGIYFLSLIFSDNKNQILMTKKIVLEK